MIEVTKFFKIDETKNTPLPVRGSKGAACYDLASDEDFVLYSGQRHMFKTNVGVELEAGEVLILRPRSKLANKYGIMVLAGEIDSDYRGEMRVILYNSGDKALVVGTGDKIVQMRVQNVLQKEPVWTSNPTETERGAEGVESKDMRM